jgi:hypothetical protein
LRQRASEDNATSLILAEMEPAYKRAATIQGRFYDHRLSVANLLVGRGRHAAQIGVISQHIQAPNRSCFRNIASAIHREIDKLLEDWESKLLVPVLDAISQISDDFRTTQRQYPSITPERAVIQEGLSRNVSTWKTEIETIQKEFTDITVTTTTPE